jgi:hypothetical protein
MIYSKIKTIHEEEIPDSVVTIGILVNESDDMLRPESFIYIYKKDTKMYIFFNTMVEMIDFYFYGNDRCKRAYVKEDTFDKMYGEFLTDKFVNLIEWTV